MYNIKTQIVTLEIPKNGSRTLVEASKTVYGKAAFKCMGHHTLEQVMMNQMPSVKQQPKNPVIVTAVLRNPVERLLSQVRQYERNKAGATLDDAMKVAWAQSDVVFKPQWKFLEVPDMGDWEFDVRMWDMKRIGEAVMLLTSAKAPHINKGDAPSQINMDRLLAHELFDDLMDSEWHYGPDFVLWGDAEKTNREGR